MFSEYASKFLAQSQSRLSSFGQPATADDTASLHGHNTHATAGAAAGEPSSRLRPGSDWQSSARGPKGFGRSFLSRGNPYQTTGSSRFGQLNFGSRYSAAAQDAPLFHSGRGDINEALGEEDEDDEDEMERDREAADLYALQRSRRVFAASRLDESTGTDNERSRTTLGDSRDEDDEDEDEDEEPLTGSGRTPGPYANEEAFAATEAAVQGARGIRSSWSGRPGNRQKSPANEPSGYGLHESRGKMVDIGLESTIAESEPPEDLTYERQHDGLDGDQPPAFQQFNPSSKARFGFLRNSAHESELGLLHRQDSEAAHTAAVADSNTLHTTAAAAATPSDGELFRHDPFFAWIYLIAVASLFATFVLVYLHTSTPGSGGKQPWGDTIYTTLLSSFHLLAIDTLVAIIVSLVWLAALRSFARPLVGLIIVAVPVVLLSFAIYPFVSSYRGDSTGGGSGLQDRVMRWASVVPGVAAVVWIYLVWRGRSALRSAVDILEFASRILAANSALVLVGLGCLTLVVLWTWAWLAMFTRVFLGGSFSSKLSRFIISASSWWLGAYFVLMYIWTLSVISGVQRGTTGATVSQWYFHRNVQPAPSSAEVVSAALHHAVTTIFGSICLSTLLALAVRLPLLLLPGRLAEGVGLFFYSLVPSSITTLTNPLTLTYAAIHSQSLTASAQGLSQLDFLSPQTPTTTLTPRVFGGGRRRRARPGTSAPLLPYRLAKLLLHATRFIMATGLGFGGWVMTARQLRIPAADGGGGGTVRGSAYAYVVGLVASFIGWGVLGAMEGTLSGIVDAVVICYGSETRMANGGGGYCMEAAYLFGGRRSDRDEAYRRRDVY